MNESVNPWSIDPAMFGQLLRSVITHEDECRCDDCTFINLIPSMLDAEGVEPNG